MTPNSANSKVPCLIGVGSNIDPEIHIPPAIAELRARFGEICCSAFYWTRPLLGRDQAPYINGVVRIETTHSLSAVRKILAEIEDAAGRIRHQGDRYAPRTLDLDLLTYGNLIREAEDIPSEDLLTRDFVLAPAVELDPDWIHPMEKQSLTELLASRFPTFPNIIGKVDLP